MGTSLHEVAQAVCNSQGFTLVARVGAGAFKETYHVRDPVGSSLALKIFNQASSPERSQREIAAMRRCSHANISRLSSIDLLSYEGREYLYILEEYLAGGTLGTRVKTSLLTVDQTLVLGEALISAVAYIASLDLVHRDLKPENIMFREDGVIPVVVDFGVVRDLSESSLTKTWVRMGPGTPYYAAPEQLNNDKELIDWRTDQFALGILLAQSAFGYHPYAEPGDEWYQTVERVARRDSPSLRFKSDAQQLGLPVLIRMAAPWPVQRFRTAGQLLDAWRTQARVNE